MRCKNCGQEVKSDFKYCPYCAGRLVQDLHDQFEELEPLPVIHEEPPLEVEDYAAAFYLNPGETLEELPDPDELPQIDREPDWDVSGEDAEAAAYMVYRPEGDFQPDGLSEPPPVWDEEDAEPDEDAPLGSFGRTAAENPSRWRSYPGIEPEDLPRKRSYPEMGPDDLPGKRSYPGIEPEGLPRKRNYPGKEPGNLSRMRSYPEKEPEDLPKVRNYPKMEPDEEPQLPSRGYPWGDPAKFRRSSKPEDELDDDVPYVSMQPEIAREEVPVPRGGSTPGTGFKVLLVVFLILLGTLISFVGYHFFSTPDPLHNFDFSSMFMSVAFNL